MHTDHLLKTNRIYGTGVKPNVKEELFGSSCCSFIDYNHMCYQGVLGVLEQAVLSVKTK